LSLSQKRDQISHTSRQPLVFGGCCIDLAPPFYKASFGVTHFAPFFYPKRASVSRFHRNYAASDKDLSSILAHIPAYPGRSTRVYLASEPTVHIGFCEHCPQ
jgi:hypothetical protein